MVCSPGPHRRTGQCRSRPSPSSSASSAASTDADMMLPTPCEDFTVDGSAGPSLTVRLHQSARRSAWPFQPSRRRRRKSGLPTPRRSRWRHSGPAAWIETWTWASRSCRRRMVAQYPEPGAPGPRLGLRARPPGRSSLYRRSFPTTCWASPGTPSARRCAARALPRKHSLTNQRRAWTGSWRSPGRGSGRHLMRGGCLTDGKTSWSM